MAYCYYHYYCYYYYYLIWFCIAIGVFIITLTINIHKNLFQYVTWLEKSSTRTWIRHYTQLIQKCTSLLSTPNANYLPSSEKQTRQRRSHEPVSLAREAAMPSLPGSKHSAAVCCLESSLQGCGCQQVGENQYSGFPQSDKFCSEPSIQGFGGKRVNSDFYWPSSPTKHLRFSVWC